MSLRKPPGAWSLSEQRGDEMKVHLKEVGSARGAQGCRACWVC